jgi:hypothetical protein
MSKVILMEVHPRKVEKVEIWDCCLRGPSTLSRAKWSSGDRKRDASSTCTVGLINLLNCRNYDL